MLYTLFYKIMMKLLPLLPWCGVFLLGVLCGVTLMALCFASREAEDAARRLLDAKTAHKGASE